MENINNLGISFEILEEVPVQAVGVCEARPCRICGEKKESVYDIFNTSYGVYNPISVIFEQSLSVQIHPNDGHPDVVCQACLDNALNSLEFDSIWKTSNTALDKYFQAVKVKTEKIIEYKEEPTTTGEELNLLAENDDEDEEENILSLPEDVSGLYECKKCKRPFFTYKNLQYHMIKHLHSTKCKICKVECFDARVLKKHYSKHKSEKITLCPWCGGIIKNGFHNFDYNYICPLCDFAYPCISFLENHVKVEHPDSEIITSDIAIVKNINDNIFEEGDEPIDETKNVLENLEDTIEYRCNRCDRVFNSMRKLENHISSLKCLFVCDICGGEYKVKMQLKMHMMDKHLGIRPHLCSFCGKSFVRKSTLIMHQHVHTKERLFQCHECGKKFVSAATLRYHSRLHTGETPYVCSLCDMGFVKSSRLKEHEQKWHLGKLQCPKCLTTFSQRCSLKTHMDRFHPNTYNKKENYQMNTNLLVEP